MMWTPKQLGQAQRCSTDNSSASRKKLLWEFMRLGADPRGRGCQLYSACTIGTKLSHKC